MINGELATYIEMAKKSKMENAIIINDTLIGTNGYCIIVVNISNSQNWRFGFNVSTAVQEVKALQDTISTLPDIISVNIYNQYIRTMELVKNTYMEINSYPNILENERFSELVNRKTKMGSTMFTIDDTAFSIYSGLLPINKADTVDLEVKHISYEFDLVKFTIYKKKDKFYINQYMKVLRV